MRVLGIGTALPAGSIPQARAADVSRDLVGDGDRRGRLLTTLFARAGVRTRHSVLVEGSGAEARQAFYPPRCGEDDRGPGTAARMAQYERHALPLAATAARQALAEAGLAAGDVSHLITVSCTGFQAPGVDVRLAQELGLDPRVGRAHVGFMGCHGLFNGLALARGLTGADVSSHVLVCAVELCTLHFHYGWDSDKLVANALFADGASSLLCAADSAHASGSLRVIGCGSCLMPGSLDAMTWSVGDHGFEMTLSAAVPGLIQEHLPGLLADWLAGHGLTVPGIRAWAVHPGGPRILSACAAALGLEETALSASHEVLERYGNMSSASIGFILRRLLASGFEGPGLAVGFGPGLTAEMFLFDR